MFFVKLVWSSVKLLFVKNVFSRKCEKVKIKSFYSKHLPVMFFYSLYNIMNYFSDTVTCETSCIFIVLPYQIPTFCVVYR